MITFACIGTGWITDSFVKSAHATGDWKLVAVYSRKEETAQHFAAKYDGAAIHTSLDDLARNSSVQAVYIASPNSFHYEQAKLLLSSRKHVIVEKPATSTSSEYSHLRTIAQEHNVFLIEAYRHLQEANFKHIIGSLGLLGRIFGASLNYASYSSRYNNVLKGETPNIFSLEYSGGSLVDIGTYPISAAVALFGRPESWTYKPIIIATGADGGGIITLNYQTFGVSCHASKVYTSTVPSEIYGENGSLILNGVTDIERVTFLDAKSKEKKELAGEKQELNLREEAKEFARIITEKDQKEAEKLDKISQTVIEITEDLRRQNGIFFGVEKK